MKNLSLVLNVILFIAVVVLYILHFSGGDQIEGERETVVGAIAGASEIAYVNSDSLLQKYDYFKDQADELEKKRVKLEAEFSNRAKGLQTEISNFQQNAQNMTMAQAKAIEEDLVKKQQNLMQYQESLQQQLMREESKVNTELYDKVSNYLKEYGKKNNYQLVLTYTKGSGVLYANDSLNITSEVVDGLNELYRADANTAGTDTTLSK